MLAEILLAALVLAVALLVTGDVTRRSSEGPHGYADGPAYDAPPTIIGASRGGRAEAFSREPSGTGIPAVHAADSARRPENISPSAGGHQHSRTHASAARYGSAQ